MPDLPNRPDVESSLAFGFSALMNRQRRELAGMGIDQAARDNEIHKKHEAELTVLLLLLLRRPWEATNDMLTTELKLPTTLTVTNADYAKWSHTYAPTLAHDLVDTNKKVIRYLFDKKAAGDVLTLEDVTLRPLADTNRIASIATTETTRAASAGEYSAANRFMAERGRKLMAIWRTSRLENVCKICKPLDGKPESVWGVYFPMGSPAHVRCNCYLDWVMV